MTTIAIIVGLTIVAFLLFLFELLTPSFGIMTALGAVSLGAAIWLGFTLSKVLGLVMIIVFVLAVPVYFAALIKLLPRSSVGRKLFLRKTGNDTAAGTPEVEQNIELIGKTGTAETQLRPSGAVRIEGRRVIGIAESGIIEKGMTVKVINLSGTDIVVRAVEDSQG
ncbi:MAG: NfeD family protein [Planctomycetota bacterium]|jgi:membrane-bound serine protease (ClpP class)